MNKDSLKTFILISLFILSLFLTRKILFNSSNDLFSSLGQDMEYRSNNEEIMSEIISPKRFLINYSEDTHTMLYSYKEYKLWEHSKEIIKEVFGGGDMKTTEIDNEEFTKYKSKKSINLEFGEEIPIYILSKILEIDISKDIANNIEKVNQIYIRGGNENFIILKNNNKVIKLDNISYESDNISNVLNNIKNSDEYINYWPARISLGTESDVYTPYSMPEDYVDIIVKNDISLSIPVEENKKIDKIAEGFFNKDISYLRKIVDNSGAIIYMYNQKKGLLIYPDGRLEYFDTLEDSVEERNLYKSLNTAMNFVESKDRWPEDVYISSIKEIESNGNKGYKFEFNYKVNGRTVFINKNMDNKNSNDILKPIEVEVYNNQVKSYKRFLRDNVVKKLERNYGRERLNPENVIEQNINIIKEIFIQKEDIENKLKKETNIYSEILASVKNISLGYYDDTTILYQKSLIDVWIIDIGNTRFVFNSHTGDILNRETIK